MSSKAIDLKVWENSLAAISLTSAAGAIAAYMTNTISLGEFPVAGAATGVAIATGIAAAVTSEAQAYRGRYIAKEFRPAKIADILDYPEDYHSSVVELEGTLKYADTKKRSGFLGIRQEEHFVLSGEKRSIDVIRPLRISDMENDWREGKVAIQGIVEYIDTSPRIYAIHIQQISPKKGISLTSLKNP